MTTSTKLSIEAFRASYVGALLEKGVAPPKPDSEQEQRLYQKWLEGHTKLQLLNEEIKNATLSRQRDS